MLSPNFLCPIGMIVWRAKHSVYNSAMNATLFDTKESEFTRWYNESHIIIMVPYGMDIRIQRFLKAIQDPDKPTDPYDFTQLEELFIAIQADIEMGCFNQNLPPLLQKSHFDPLRLIYHMEGGEKRLAGRPEARQQQGGRPKQQQPIQQNGGRQRNHQYQNQNQNQFPNNNQDQYQNQNQNQNQNRP
jgi:hypothetical protein